MPSSTSSSETGKPASPPRDLPGAEPLAPPVPTRPVPHEPWGRLGLIALVLVLALVGAWEAWARDAEYGQSYVDSADFWVRSRRAVRPDSLVAIGSSRILFDLDSEVVAAETGQRPIYLARVGSSPLPMLRELAADPAFRGTVLVGVTPPLFFAGSGPPVARAEEYVDHRQRQSYSERIGQWLGMRVEEVLHSTNPEIGMRGLLERLPLPPRRGFDPPPDEPPYFGRIHADRSYSMIPRMERDPGFQRQVQQVWTAIMGNIPELPPEVIEGMRQGVIAAAQRDVEAIRGRGGRVIFIRFPSSHEFRDYERTHQPRERYWDELLRATGAPGIHFEDHPELRSWDLPEWSHLTDGDAAEFTRRLVPHLRPHLGLGES